MAFVLLESNYGTLYSMTYNTIIVICTIFFISYKSTSDSGLLLLPLFSQWVQLYACIVLTEVALKTNNVINFSG